MYKSLTRSLLNVQNGEYLTNVNRKKTRKEKREKLEERGISVIECCINLPFQITRLRFYLTKVK